MCVCLHSPPPSRDLNSSILYDFGLRQAEPETLDPEPNAMESILGPGLIRPEEEGSE